MSNRFSALVRGGLGDLAIVLTALAIILVLGSNLFDLFDAQAALQKTLDQQKATIGNAQKVEAQLEALASGTQDLATRGNANAQRIVVTLKQNGISINPPKPHTP